MCHEVVGTDAVEVEVVKYVTLLAGSDSDPLIWNPYTVPVLLFAIASAICFAAPTRALPVSSNIGGFVTDIVVVLLLILHMLRTRHHPRLIIRDR